MDLTDHLIMLPHGQWAVWRYFGLRGAGIPAHLIHSLSAPDAAASADQLLEAETAQEQARQTALTATNIALDQLRLDGQWDDKTQRKLLLKTIQQLNKQQTPTVAALPDTLSSAVTALVEAQTQQQTIRAQFESVFAQSIRVNSATLRELVQTRTFREAMLWQNRNAYHTAIVPLLNTSPDERNKDVRQREALAASYLQRYCVKNDTIGAFGPVGWASFEPNSSPITVQPGQPFVDKCDVYFDQWGIDIIADKIAANKTLRPWFAPRLYPWLHIEGNLLYRPLAAPVPLPERVALLLSACDGKRIAQEIAAQLCQTPHSGYENPNDVYMMLTYLSDEEEMIRWTLELPVQWQPDQALRHIINRIDDTSLREPILVMLDELETTRRAVKQAVGNPEKLDKALADTENTFARLTNAEETVISSIESKMGRTLLYQDCHRNLDMSLGSTVLNELSAPLSLLLDTARWFAHQTASAYRRGFDAHYAMLAEQLGQTTIPLLYFMPYIETVLFDKADKPLIGPIQTEFHRRWAQLLAGAEYTEGQGIQLDSVNIREKVAEQFAAADSGWLEARYHTPDIMIAASSAEAIAQGDYLFVLGELHMAFNTLQNPFFVVMHPSQNYVSDAMTRDLPEPLLCIVCPRSWNWVTSRTVDYLIHEKDFWLSFTDDGCAQPRMNIISISELVIEKQGDNLIVRSRDHRVVMDLIRFFAFAISIEVINSFSLMPKATHRPRISIDKLVVQRESWRFEADELPFAYEKSETERFLAIRRWAKAIGLPRYVFVKSPVEWKPFYVDFDSPILVELLARTVRRTIEDEHKYDPFLTFNEMLPNLEQLWLPDAEGNLYTSELRIVTVDMKGHADPITGD